MNYVLIVIAECHLVRICSLEPFHPVSAGVVGGQKWKYGVCVCVSRHIKLTALTWIFSKIIEITGDWHGCFEIVFPSLDI